MVLNTALFSCLHVFVLTIILQWRASNFPEAPLHYGDGVLLVMYCLVFCCFVFVLEGGLCQAYLQVLTSLTSTSVSSDQNIIPDDFWRLDVFFFSLQLNLDVFGLKQASLLSLYPVGQT